MKTIHLQDYPYPALILPCASGIEIEQQTGGRHPVEHRIEGLFLPLPLREHELLFFMEALEAIHPGCGCPVMVEEGHKMNDSLRMHGIPLAVDFDRRMESTEAWLHVQIMGKGDKWYLRPNSSTLHSYQQFARGLKPDITKEEVDRLLDQNLLGNLSMLADFAHAPAILTWENCD